MLLYPRYCLPALALALGAVSLGASTPAPWRGYDLVVAADGTGDFTTIEKAVQSIPVTRHLRTIIFIRNGVYNEKIRIDAPCVTLRGESRAGTRIEFNQGTSEFNLKRDNLGVAVVNINGDDCVLQNLTVKNTNGVIGPHAVAIFGKGDRTVLEDADVLSQGADTLSLWRDNGRSYQARLGISGSVDFICPHGWSYLTDCAIHQVNTKAEASIWNDGSLNRDQKLVLRDCRFDGPAEGWTLGRHHHDGQFYLLDCTFSRGLRDQPIYRVKYPLPGNPPVPSDETNNRRLDPTNRWGERAYYYNSHRQGGDYAWMANSLDKADGAPTPAQVTAAWTFRGTWDPERPTGPAIRRVEPTKGWIAVVFSEAVTVKGRPRLVLADGTIAAYASGTGTDILVFNLPAAVAPAAVAGLKVRALDFNGGTILASEAYALQSPADLTLPAL